MNFMKFINSDYLKSNPLCGISTYKDELNLATGACTRQIKKLVLTGEENWQGTDDTASKYLRDDISDYKKASGVICMSTHYSGANNVLPGDTIPNNSVCFNLDSDLKILYLKGFEPITLADFKAYLAQQYAAGTPVTVWYVLATPTTETITVSSGLSGTEEGYLNQSGTPTPDNPIYPTANTVEKWFDLNHYIMGTSTDTLTSLPAVLYPNDTTATVGLKGNTSQQSGTTTVPSKSVTVSSLESGTNYALFPKADFPDAVVGDTINIVVSGTSYSQKVMKIDTSYVYIENRTV